MRFLIGGSAAQLNLVLAYVGVDLLGLNTDLQQNYVNLVAMETSLVYSFLSTGLLSGKTRAPA